MFYSKREESLCVIPNTVKCLPINILAERFWVHCLAPQNFCPIDDEIPQQTDLEVTGLLVYGQQAPYDGLS